MTEKQLQEYADAESEYRGVNPIYRIMLFENPDKPWVYSNGIVSGFPDLGCQTDVGFYYDLHDAVSAVENNSCDMREHVYSAGFILCLFPGLYGTSGPGGRLYFVWDQSKNGFVITEEPEIFIHVAY